MKTEVNQHLQDVDVIESVINYMWYTFVQENHLSIVHFRYYHV